MVANALPISANVAIASLEYAVTSYQPISASNTAGVNVNVQLLMITDPSYNPSVLFSDLLVIPANTTCYNTVSRRHEFNPILFTVDRGTINYGLQLSIQATMQDINLTSFTPATNHPYFQVTFAWQRASLISNFNVY